MKWRPKLADKLKRGHRLSSCLFSPYGYLPVSALITRNFLSFLSAIGDKRRVDRHDIAARWRRHRRSYDQRP
jgi:hypothetical protein